jgi:hypothetical protein
VSGKASVTLNPGLYLIEGGGFTVSGNASVSGAGVMIYNTGSNYPNAGGSFGGITLSGNGTFSLSASATSTGGTDAGILIFQPTANTRALSLSGNGVAGITGTVYAPSAQVVISGNAKLSGALVADELSLSGNGVSTQAADGAGGSAIDTASAGTLLAGNLFIYVSDPSGLFTANEQGRILDAINAWNTLLVPYCVTISEVSDPNLANVVIDTSWTSAAGSAADGVLGSYGSNGEITILQGWNWYDGSDTTQIGANQYDFQTVVTHELGHALGLGGNADLTSPMYEVLAPGVVRRAPTTNDLNIPEPPDGADPERAAMPPVGQPVAGIVMAVGDVHAVSPTMQVSFSLPSAGIPTTSRALPMTDGFQVRRPFPNVMEFERNQGNQNPTAANVIYDTLFANLAEIGGRGQGPGVREDGTDARPDGDSYRLAHVMTRDPSPLIPILTGGQQSQQPPASHVEDSLCGHCTTLTPTSDLAALWMLAAIVAGRREQTSEERCRRWLFADA